MRCRSLAFLAVLLMVPIAALAQTNPFDGLNTGDGRTWTPLSTRNRRRSGWLESTQCPRPICQRWHSTLET